MFILKFAIVFKQCNGQTFWKRVWNIVMGSALIYLYSIFFLRFNEYKRNQKEKIIVELNDNKIQSFIYRVNSKLKSIVI